MFTPELQTLLDYISSMFVANLVNFNINQLAIMIVCVHIMDVIIFQNMVTGIYI